MKTYETDAFTINYRKGCLACDRIKHDKSLITKIFNTKTFNPREDRTLNQLAKELDIPPKSLYTHAKRHQFQTPEAKRQAIERVISEKVDKQVQKDLITHSDVRQIIMEKGLKEIKSGKIKLNAQTIASVARDQMNFELKSKDQQLKMAEMIWHFASGESSDSDQYDKRVIAGETRDSFDPTAEPSNDY